MKRQTATKSEITTSDELNEYYNVVKNEFDDHLKREISKEPAEIGALLEKGLSGGKKLRPVLCKLVSDALGGDTHLAFECGMALELVHCGALIHDDWIDGDKFRRAAPSLWNELGPRTSVLVADLMAATGSLHGAISLETGKSLARCVRNLSEGAIADFTDKDNYNEAVYLHRIKRKTGALYSTAAELGALVSPRTDLAPNMYKYGECVGILYQITDDYLDLLNSLITKTPVGDLALKIPTLPLTKLSKYPNYQEAVNEFIYNGNTEKLISNVDIKHAQEIFDDLIQPWQDMSKKFLEDVPESNSKRLLEQVPLSFANELITKDKN
ncbi:MAG: polyprenyl synthetase family protein [Candidatus Poseidoniia archaeon]|nr:polyprenyl synthetase family protein [Candidatus Poseidoniia archaeon]